MDINRLNEFLVLTKCLNYSKAASQLYLTQPVLSRHIHDLEHQVGASLLIRNTHKVELTPIGKLFAEESEQIIRTYNKSMERIRAATAVANGVLHIGFLEAAVKPFFKNFIVEFSNEHPQISLELQSYDLEELLTAFNEDQLDIAFATHVDDTYFPGLMSRHILRDKLYVVTHSSSPLKLQKSISIQALSDLPAIMLSKEKNAIAYDFHKNLFKKYNAQLNVVKEVRNVENALFSVSLNKGFFIVPEHLLYLVSEQVALELADDECYINVNLLWKKDNPNPATSIFEKDFLKFMRKA